jgi:hypothetical protein
VKNPHLVTQALLVVLIGLQTYAQFHPASPGVAPCPPPSPAPAPAADATALGRAYIPAIASAYGDAWQAAGGAVAEGKSISEARQVFQLSLGSARKRDFARMVAPALERVLPEGAEPETPEKRAEVAKLFRDFGAGLKGGK